MKTIGILVKAAVLTPFILAQIVLWVYCFIQVIGSYIYATMSWEFEQPDNWIILHIAFFIWTNQIFKIINKEP